MTGGYFFLKNILNPVEELLWMGYIAWPDHVENLFQAL